MIFNFTDKYKITTNLNLNDKTLEVIIIYIFEGFRNISLITGCPKKGPNFELFSPISEILNIIHGYEKLNNSSTKVWIFMKF